MDTEKLVSSAVKGNKTLLGSRSVLLAAMNGKVTGIVYAKNTPKSTVGDIMHYAGISGIETHEFAGNSVELGELCGKPFSVLLMGIKK